MLRPRRKYVMMLFGNGYEYTTTAHGKLVPNSPTSPMYSDAARAETKRLLEEKAYIESMSGPVKTYSINDIQGGTNQ